MLAVRFPGSFKKQLLGTFWSEAFTNLKTEPLLITLLSGSSACESLSSTLLLTDPGGLLSEHLQPLRVSILANQASPWRSLRYGIKTATAAERRSEAAAFTALFFGLSDRSGHSSACCSPRTAPPPSSSGREGASEARQRRFAPPQSWRLGPLRLHLRPVCGRQSAAHCVGKFVPRRTPCRPKGSAPRCLRRRSGRGRQYPAGWVRGRSGCGCGSAGRGEGRSVPPPPGCPLPPDQSSGSRTLISFSLPPPCSRN